MPRTWKHLHGYIRGRTRRRFLASAGALGGITTLAGCTASEFAEVEITADGFDPDEVTIIEEGSVTWINATDENHTVTNASENWEIDTELEPGQGVQFDFDRADEYLVVCSIHGDPDEFSGERMTVIVEREDSVGQPL